MRSGEVLGRVRDLPIAVRFGVIVAVCALSLGFVSWRSMSVFATLQGAGHDAETAARQIHLADRLDVLAGTSGNEGMRHALAADGGVKAQLSGTCGRPMPSSTRPSSSLREAADVATANAVDVVAARLAAYRSFRDSLGRSTPAAAATPRPSPWSSPSRSCRSPPRSPTN